MPNLEAAPVDGTQTEKTEHKPAVIPVSPLKNGDQQPTPENKEEQKSMNQEKKKVAEEEEEESLKDVNNDLEMSSDEDSRQDSDLEEEEVGEGDKGKVNFSLFCYVP